MVKDAEANADADKKKIEAIEAKNNADSIISSTEKSLKEHGSKIPKADKEKIEKSLEDLKKVLSDEKSEAKCVDMTGDYKKSKFLATYSSCFLRCNIL